MTTQRATPSPDDGLRRRAAAAFTAGDLAEAESLSRALLRRDPRSADALHHLGLIAHRRGQPADAIALLRRALRLAPKNANVHFNLGVVLIETGDVAAAIESQRAAVACDPEYGAAWSSLSAALYQAGQFDEAVAAARRAVELSPCMVGAAVNLAIALEATGEETAPVAAFLACVERNPESADAWFELARALQRRGQAQAAIQAYERTCTLRPDHVMAHAQCALARLLVGDLARGWAEYEWRLRRPGLDARRSTAPRWRGEDLADRTILVHTEQGLGDALHMVRYLAPLAEVARAVIVEVDRAVLPVVPRVPRVTAVASGEVIPAHDVVSPLLSLPLRFGTTLETIPGRAPYLHVDASRVDAWDKMLSERGGGRRVGLVWAGNPDHDNDHNRSIPFASLAPLVEQAGFAWYGLHNRPLDAGAAAAGVIDLSARLTDLGETAAAIMGMDLVITVDTAVAHLAGGLGKPVWILVPFVPDWRWLLDRDDSPWYPTARLFRQRRAGDWDAVIGRVAAALSAGGRARANT